MAGKDDDASGVSWPWNDKTFRRMQDEHDRFMRDHDLRTRLHESADDHRTSSTSPSSSNSLFTTFKSLVDEQLTTFSDHFRQFPSNITELRARMQRAPEWRQQEEQAFSQAWTGSASSPDHIQLQSSRLTDQEKDLVHSALVRVISRAYELNQDVPAEKIHRLYDDPESELGLLDRLANPMLALGGAWFFMPETGDKLPTPSDWRWPAPSPRWLSVDWFKNSPYSPVRLESHPDMRHAGSKWREAFEDLMDTSLDKPHTPALGFGVRSLFGNATLPPTSGGPGLDWMLSLQMRGVLPPMLSRFWKQCQVETKSPLSPLLEAFPWSASQLSWGSDRPQVASSALQQDISQLADEIATKYTLMSQNEHEHTQEQEESTTSSNIGLAIFPELAATSTVESRARMQEHETTQYDERADRDETSAKASDEEYSELDMYEYMESVAALRERNLAERELIMESCRAQYDIERIKHAVSAVHSWHKSNPDTPDWTERDTLQWMLDGLASLFKPNDEKDRSSSPRVPLAAESLASHNDELVQSQHSSTATLVAEPQTTDPTVESPSGRPSVLSALTTTKTTRMPDGTVTTEVVLKRRFADGRVETTETVHTSHEELEKGDEPAGRKSNGWFWS